MLELTTKQYDILTKEAFNIHKFPWFEDREKSHWLEMKTECVIRSAYFRATRRYAQWITKQEGIEKETIIHFFKDNNSKYDRPETPFWIQILDKKTKITNDILVPPKLGLLSAMISENVLLFRKPKNEKDEINGLTKFYYVKLVEK